MEDQVAFEKVKKLIENMDAARTKFQKEGKDALKDAFKEFFDAVPEAKCIGWTQSTPSFNDGDPCRFSVHELNLFLTKKALEDLLGRKMTQDEYKERLNDACDGDQYSLLYSDTAPPRAKEISKLFDDFVAEVQDDDLFEQVFGEFAKVTATPGKFKIEDYDGDY